MFSTLPRRLLLNLALLALGAFILSFWTLTYGSWPSRLAQSAFYPNPTSHVWIKYTTMTGFFLQDETSTDPSMFDYTTTNFGLINRTYPTGTECGPGSSSWQRFECYINSLNEESARDINFKLLYMGRHGEGWHNAAETFYGTPAWDCYYSKLDGGDLDGNQGVVWADAHLTPIGISQAQVAANFWASRIVLEKIPQPQSYYTSPLSRCLETANVTFSKLDLTPKFIPIVKELFRESITGHTCDRRSNKTYIQDNFPFYVFKPGFSEQDMLWKPLLGEPQIDQDIRSRKALDDVFASDGNTFVSITSHSGEIASILRVVNHQIFPLNTGAIIPVLVKAETIRGTTAPTATESWTQLPDCSPTTKSNNI